jgi:hypothetical protein
LSIAWTARAIENDARFELKQTEITHSYQRNRVFIASAGCNEYCRKKPGFSPPAHKS